jgi:glycosyltransferase involved in cell wall biosynthesis
MVSRRTGAPYTVWLLGSDVWLAERFPLGSRVLRRVVSRARFVAADSFGLASDAATKTSSHVDFLPSSMSLPTARRDPGSNPILGFVGRYHRNKGPDLAIRAMVELRSQYPSAKLEMHGSGDMQDELAELAKQLGLNDSVTIGPPLDRQGLAAKLATWSALLIPSRIESIPMILGDAIQAGIPVVATDVGDLGRACADYDVAVVVEAEPAAIAFGASKAISGPKTGNPSSSAARLLDPLRAATTLLKALHSGDGKAD